MPNHGKVKQVSARCYADKHHLTLKLINHNIIFDTILKRLFQGVCTVAQDLTILNQSINMQING